MIPDLHGSIYYRLAEAARLVKLQKILHPNWRVAVSKEVCNVAEEFIHTSTLLCIFFSISNIHTKVSIEADNP